MQGIRARHPASAGSTSYGWLIVIMGMIVGATILVSTPDNLGQKILAMVVLAVAASLAVGNDLLHPYVWFGSTFAIYSISGPLLLHLGVHPYTQWGGYRMDMLDFSGAMDYQFLALAVVLAIVGPTRFSFHQSASSPDVYRLYDGAFAVLIATAIIGVANIGQIVTQGYSSKGDVVLNGDWTTRLSFSFNIAATALGVYLSKLFSERRISLAYITLILAVVVGILMVLLIGQRHFLFRAGLVCLLTLHIFHRRISGRSMLLLAVFALVMSTILGGYKMALVANETLQDGGGSILDEARTLFALRDPTFAEQPLFVQYLKVGLVAALGSEAMTPGNNMAMILARFPGDIPYFYGSTIPGDIMRSVLPGFIVQPLIDSTSGAYNRFVFPHTSEAGGGVGFTIAGYGFLHFGVIGLLMVMAIIGATLRAIYRWAARSPVGLMFFIGFFPVAIYAARNDISGPLSQGLKHVLLPLFAMMVVSYLKGSRRVA